MQHRKLTVGALTALLAIAAPAGVEAAWNGVRLFPCYGVGSSWTLDGLYGPNTERAVRQFQSEHGLRVDGIAGPETLRALKLPAHRVLRCGMGGRDVLKLQHRLATLGVWDETVGGKHAATTSSRPAPRRTPAPGHATPAPWASPMVQETPEPEESMAPEEPTPSPRVSAPTEPPAVVEEPLGDGPTVEVKAGTWLIPISGYWYVPVGGPAVNTDFSVVRGSWTGDASVWLGNVGVGGGITAFNLVNPAFNLGPFSTAGSLMYDGLLKYRFDHGYYQLFAGYRGFNTTPGLNFGTAGVGLDRPLAGEWLWLNGHLQGGHNFQSSYFYDGQLGLGLRAGFLGVDLGFRHLGLQDAASPLATVNGPVANFNLKF